MSGDDSRPSLRAPAQETVFRPFPLASPSGPLYLERMFLLRLCINQSIHHLRLYRSLYSNKVCQGCMMQQKILWAEVQKETGRLASRWTVRDVLANERCGRAVLDFLSSTKVGRLVPPLEESKGLADGRHAGIPDHDNYELPGICHLTHQRRMRRCKRQDCQNIWRPESADLRRHIQG